MADIKTINAVPVAGIKTYQGIPLVDVKTINALALEAALPPTGPIPEAGLGVWYKADEGVYSQSAANFVYTNIEHLTIPTNSSLRFGNIPWTAGGWAWHDSFGIMVMGTRCSGPLEMEWQLYSNSTMLTGNTWNGSAHPQVNLAGVVALGVWQFFMISYDPAGGGVLSLQANNGTPASGVVGAVTDHPTGGIMLGGNTWGAPSASFNGRLQNWFMFGRALSPAERTFLYNGGAGRGYEELDTAFKADLRAWWPLSEWSGSRVDLSGNNNTLTDNNTVTVATGHIMNRAVPNSPAEIWNDFSPNVFHQQRAPTGPVAMNAPTLVGDVRNGLPVVRFDGINTAMSTPGTMTGGYLCGPQAETVFIVMWQSATDGESTLYRWDSSSADSNALSGHFAWSDDQFYWYTGAAVGTMDGRMVGPAPAGWREKWHVLECVRDGTTGSVLVDGTVVPLISSLGGTFNTAGVHNFRLAYDERTGRFFQGDVAELIIYNRTLSATERDTVREYLQEKWGFVFKADSVAGLKAWYKADVGVMSQSAAQFVGANVEYLSIPTNTSLQFGNIEWTIGGWVYIEASGLQSIACKGTSGTNVDWQVYYDGSVLRANAFNSASYPDTSGPAPGLNQWHLVVVSFSPSGGGVLSLQMDNGTSFPIVAGVLVNNATGELRFGTQPSGGLPYTGRLQNWFMFGRALNTTERSFLYNSGNGRSYEELDTAFKADLRAWWAFDEVSGTRRDRHTNNNHLTDNNTVGVANGKVLNPASDGALVAQWTDQSGVGSHLIQTVHSSRPPYKAVGKNGLPTLQFTGPPTANQLTTSVPLTIGTAFTALLYEGSLPAADYYGFLSTAGTYLFIMYSTQTYWLVGALTNIMRDEVVTNFVDNLWHDYSGTGTPAEHAFLYMGVDRLIPGRDWIGESGEVLIYDTVLSTEDQALVRNYLRQKWGLP